MKSPRTAIMVAPTYVRKLRSTCQTGIIYPLVLVPRDQNQPHRCQSLDTNFMGCHVQSTGSEAGSCPENGKERGVGQRAPYSVSIGESSSLQGEEEGTQPMRGPARSVANSLDGRHTFNSLRCEGRDAAYKEEAVPTSLRMLKWAEFKLKFRLDKDWENPPSLLGDISMEEPLGNCGLYVLLWWLKVEAHIDKKLPTQRVTSSLLGITTPSEHASWFELPTDERVRGTRMAEPPCSTPTLVPKEGPLFGNTSSPRPTRSIACMQKLNRRGKEDSRIRAGEDRLGICEFDQGILGYSAGGEKLGVCEFERGILGITASLLSVISATFKHLSSFMWNTLPREPDYRLALVPLNPIKHVKVDFVRSNFAMQVASLMTAWPGLGVASGELAAVWLCMVWIVYLSRGWACTPMKLAPQLHKAMTEDNSELAAQFAWFPVLRSSTVTTGRQKDDTDLLQALHACPRKYSKKNRLTGARANSIVRPVIPHASCLPCMQDIIKNHAGLNLRRRFSSAACGLPPPFV
ncbi:hypothetical protein VNO77_19151 [Canavalia gladiata]|uniref:Uncharacterized protein n=1 Tax=Canavalia gladiata TaxID=3824 RepID=A0AAN9QPC4_CANGL